MVIIKILFLIFLSLPVLASNYSLITDLDDTLKITNGKNLTQMIKNILYKQDTFLGMPELLRELTSSGVKDQYLLSASPILVKENVDKLILKNGLSFNEVYLRKIKDLKDKGAYKLKKLEYIISLNDDKLILIGDDQDEDHLIYLMIKKKYPKRVHKIFIHRVQNKPIDPSLIGYITPFEIAWELRDILYAHSLDSIYEKLKNGFYKIIPTFSHCPTEKWMNEESLLEYQDMIIKFCKSRTL